MFYCLNKSYSQASSAGSNNQPVATTDFLGWDNTVTSSTTPNSLDIATQATGSNAIPINFYTNGAQRMNPPPSGCYATLWVTGKRIYSYSLLADDKLVSRKKMVKQD